MELSVGVIVGAVVGVGVTACTSPVNPCVATVVAAVGACKARPGVTAVPLGKVGCLIAAPTSA